MPRQWLGPPAEPGLLLPAEGRAHRDRCCHRASVKMSRTEAGHSATTSRVSPAPPTVLSDRKRPTLRGRCGARSLAHVSPTCGVQGLSSVVQVGSASVGGGRGCPPRCLPGSMISGRFVGIAGSSGGAAVLVDETAEEVDSFDPSGHTR
jgi:hypothetical protein